MEKSEPEGDGRVPPLSLLDGEQESIDSTIGKMARLGIEKNVSSSSLRTGAIYRNEQLCRVVDELISQTLFFLRNIVKTDSAEKLFERLANVVDGWEDEDEQRVLGIVFIRLIDTMKFFVAYKRKFRGRVVEHSVSREDAHAELRIRGLTSK